MKTDNKSKFIKLMESVANADTSKFKEYLAGKQTLNESPQPGIAQPDVKPEVLPAPPVTKPETRPNPFAPSIEPDTRPKGQLEENDAEDDVKDLADQLADAIAKKYNNAVKGQADPSGQQPQA